jgi:ATP-dependent helicase IRC3
MFRFLLHYILSYFPIAERKSTLVFCVNLSHVRNLTDKFRTLGLDARYIYSKTPAAERKELLASFKAGEFPILVNCGTLSDDLVVIAGLKSGA